MDDVLIAGGGAAGLALALSLRRAFGPGFRVALADPGFGSGASSARVSALTAGSRNLLAALGVWPELAPRAQPILAMRITDSRRRDAVRPEFLHFDQPLSDGSPFAYMAHDGDLKRSLEAAARAAGVEFIDGAVSRHLAGPANVEVWFRSGETRRARVLVGCDGLRSRVRQISGIETIERDYRRSAIVATIAHEEDHGGTATQHFLPPGPFAMLPLPGRESSIVWTERNGDAALYATLPEGDFVDEVERRFGRSLGALRLASKPALLPLRASFARRFTAPRVALVGEAAHVVHPLAGQGLNLGFRDVAALVSALAGPVRLGLDPGSELALRAYEQARFFDTAAMVAATDGLHRLFSNDVGPLRLARDFGMAVLDRAPRLKRALIRDAAGLAGDAPALLRGELP